MMKRMMALILALVLVVTMVSVQAFAQEAGENTDLPAPEGNSFGSIVNHAITAEPAETADSELPTAIHSLTIEGKTAVVSLTADVDAKLVVGIYDDAEDRLLASAVMDLTASGETQEITLEIDIDEMPEYFRGKALLLDKTSNEPLSQTCCYEKATRGYREIAEAKVTDFPEELVLNLDENVNTNFAVFREDVVSSDASRIRNNGDGTYTVTDPTAEEKSLGPADVLVAEMPDGDLLIVKVLSVSLNGNTLVITEDPEVQAEDVFQMIKLDINSVDYGIVAAPGAEANPSGTNFVTPGMQLHGEDDDPLHTGEWKVGEVSLELELKKKIPDLTFALKCTPYIATQYYWSGFYSYCSAGMKLEFELNIEYAKGDVKVQPLAVDTEEITLEVPTNIPTVHLLATVGVGFEYEAAASTSFKATVFYGKEFFMGTGMFHDISKPVETSSEMKVEGKFSFFVSGGVGLGFISGKITKFAMKYVSGLTVSAAYESTNDAGEKLHVCAACAELQVTHTRKVVAGFEILELFTPKLELNLGEKALFSCYRCFVHEESGYPFDESTKADPHHGFGKCDRYAYKVTLKVRDENGGALTNMPVTITRTDSAVTKVFEPNALTYGYMTQEELVTDEYGELVCYLENGQYLASANGSSVLFTVCGRPVPLYVEGDAVPPAGEEMRLKIVADERVRVGSGIALLAILETAACNIDVTDQVQWDIDNESVARLSEDGRSLTCLEDGTVQISATYTGGEGYCVAKHKLRVYDIIDEGVSGNITWELGADYVLKITGTGYTGSSGWRAYNPKIQEVYVGEGITEISSGAFEDCVSLTKVHLPDSLERISSKAFRNCVSLNTIYIPKNVSYIASDAFLGCTSLTSIDVDPENPYFTVVDGMVLSADGKELRCIPVARYGVLRIPDGVEKIADYVCSGAEITALELPDTVCYIGRNAFENCTKLVRISVYDSEFTVSEDFRGQKSISYRAFFGCTALKTVAFPKNVEKLDSSFEGCTALESVRIPEHILQLGSSTFKDCTALKEVFFPEQVSDEQSTYSFGSNFKGCTALRYIALPEGLTEIDYSMFQGCTALSGVYIPASVVRIQDAAFENCLALSGVELPEGLQKIGTNAFKCSGLVYISIPASVTQIEGYAFQNCKFLFRVFMPEQITEVSNIDYLDYGVFCGCSMLQSIRLPEGMTRINSNLFRDCEQLKEANVPGTVIHIGQHAFYNTAIGPMTLPAGLQEISDYAFAYCPNLTSLELPEGLTYFLSSAFKGSGLEYMVVPDSVDSGYASLAYPLPGSCFQDCKNLQWVQLGENYIDMHSYLFARSSVQRVYIRGLLTEEVPESAFYQCDNLTDIYYAHSESEWPGVDKAWSDSVFDHVTIHFNYTGVPGAEAEGDEASEPQAENVADIRTQAQIPETQSASEPEAQTDVITLTYSDLDPGREYLLLMLQNKECPIVPDNLLYIDQYTADQDGNLTVQFIPRLGGTDAEPQLIAMPHKYVSEVTEPTCKTRGYTMNTCIRCGHTKKTNSTAKVDHKFQDNACIWCGEIQYAVDWVSANTSLTGSIDLNFYVTLSDTLVDDPSTFVRFTCNGKTVDVPLKDAEISRKNFVIRYRFSYKVYAKAMTDVITAQVMTKDGPVGEAKDYSVAEYCYDMIDYTKNKKVVALCKAMLNYGAAAQNLFGYNLDNLANAGLSEEEKVIADFDAAAFAHSMTGAEEGIKASGAKLLLEADVAIQVSFALTGSKPVTDYTFTIDGVETDFTRSSGNKYYFELDGIAASRFDELHAFQVGGLTVNYSVLSYANQVYKSSASPEVRTLVNAMYAYYMATDAYVN